MSPLSVEAKAARLVEAGGVQVAVHDQDRTEAVVASATDPAEAYAVGWNRAEGWWCGCPARRTCCHVVAVRQTLASSPSRVVDDPAPACLHDPRTASGVAWCRRCGVDLPAGGGR